MKINFIDRQGAKHTIDADPGIPLESAISQTGIQDSFGICGGACACASCHVYVEQQNFNTLAPADEMEHDVLEDMAFEPESNSRLGCQLELTTEMEGWTFTIAPY